MPGPQTILLRFYRSAHIKRLETTDLMDEALSRTPSNHKPAIFSRYVDDCFAVFDSLDSIKMFCDSLNEIHPNTKFTTEIQNNKCIKFLDVLVDNSSTTIATSTFPKPTSTGLYSK